MKNMITPPGTAMWAKIHQPAKFEDKEIGYTIDLELDKQHGEKLVKELLAVLEQAKQDEKFANKKWPKEPVLGYQEKDGKYVFRFKAKHEIKDKEGNIIKRKIPIFDKHGARIDDVNIGNGSIIVISFAAVPFWVNQFMAGVSLKLRAIQVLELVEYTPKNSGIDASYFGFNTEDNDEEVPI